MRKFSAMSGLLAALMLTCGNSAGATEVPTDTVVQNLNGVQQYIMTYTVSPALEAEELIQEPFEYEDYTYTYASVTKQENKRKEEKRQSQTVTVETEKKDLSSVLAALSPTLAYDDGHYSGTLALDHTTIHTEAAGYERRSYTVTEVKEIGSLDSNDMAYIPAATVKNGMTLPLSSVDWQVQGTTLVDDLLTPSSYKAVATYAGKASFTAATGYVTTAQYVGEVACDEVESVTYTITYVGEPSGNLFTRAFRGIAAHPVTGAASVLAIAALTTGGVLFARRRQNQDVETYSREISNETEENHSDEV